MSFLSIDKIINKRFAKSPLKKEVTAALVCEEFDKLMLSVMGEKIENMARTMYLKDKVLSVACLSPVVAQELKMREGELIEKINGKMEDELVERLRLLT